MARHDERNVSAQEIGKSFYRDLSVLYENSFPKVCASCGKRYESMAAFLTNTDQTHGSSGLMDVEDSSARRVVALFRNCRCGSTLMVECRDRRSNTAEGKKARAAFGRLLAKLQKAGMPVAEAREELLRLMRGEQAPRLEELLSKFKE